MAAVADLDVARAVLDEATTDVDRLTPAGRAALADELRALLDELGPQELPRDRALAKRLRAAADVLESPPT